MLALLVVLACLLACLLASRVVLGARFESKTRKVPHAETGLVKQTQARWKDRPLVSGPFSFEAGIPILEGSNPGKGVQKVPISPRGRGAPAPGRSQGFWGTPHQKTKSVPYN